ncbi:DUF4917 family protein [Herbaspirillum frisingense]|uniref:DUF4917 family protein n=1 Tax=Herbaspirillum frisingense TaxID=92645 RepID=UPI0039AEB289
MPEQKIDHHLIHWDEIRETAWKSLLLGNGFSINVWERFGYKSLYEVAKGGEVQQRLNAQSVALFDKLNSTNFEEVLRILFHARLVDEQLGAPQRDAIDDLYTSTKNALAAAVSYSHVPHDMDGLSAINRELRNYRNIFTTNYDLIPYWSIMFEDTWRFKDLFWNEGNTFDPENTSVNADRSVICYLHGAIHLVELPDGKTKKLTANGLNSLVDLFDLEHPEYFPLFISEGTSEHKLSRIKRNDYLRFSFEKFQALDGSLVVLGQSLNKDFDQHLLDALRNSDLASIAVGVWPNQAEEKILEFKARVLAEIGKKEIYFFDSTTHPLGISALRHEV